MEIKIEITGITPLLLHRFTDEAAANATDSTRSSIQSGDRGTPREQAEPSLYTYEGKPIIPGPNLFRAIIDGGKFFKAGKSKITTQKSSLIPSCVSIEEIVIPIKHKKPWEVDTRPIRIPATGGRILRHRPRFDDWALTFSLSVDTDTLGTKLLREIIDATGKKIGLGDFRPDCKGMYGKFVVTKWQEKK